MSIAKGLGLRKLPLSIVKGLGAKISGKIASTTPLEPNLTLKVATPDRIYWLYILGSKYKKLKILADKPVNLNKHPTVKPIIPTIMLLIVKCFFTLLIKKYLE